MLKNLYICFLFYNDISNSISELKMYPLFKQNKNELLWNTFIFQMNKLSVFWNLQWCETCENIKSICKTEAFSIFISSIENSSSFKSNGIFKTIAGVIEIMITLAVVLGIAGLMILIGGMRLVSKKGLSSESGLERKYANEKEMINKHFWWALTDFDAF